MFCCIKVVAKLAKSRKVNTKQIVNNTQNPYFMLNFECKIPFCFLYIRWFGEKLLPLHPKSAYFVAEDELCNVEI